VSSNGHGEVCCCLALGPHCHFYASNHGGSFFRHSIFYYEHETNFLTQKLKGRKMFTSGDKLYLQFFFFGLFVLFCSQVVASHGHGGHHHDNGVSSLSLSLFPKLTKCGGVWIFFFFLIFYSGDNGMFSFWSKFLCDFRIMDQGVSRATVSSDSFILILFSFSTLTFRGPGKLTLLRDWKLHTSFRKNGRE